MLSDKYFFGTYNNSIDAKSRIIIPSKFREKLGEGCVVTIGIENCLCVYSQEDFDRLAVRMSEIPDSAIRARSFVRALFGNATVCEFDKQGRIVVPQHLKEQTNIEKELVTIGVMDRVEIWAKEVWASDDTTALPDREELAEALREFGF